MLNLKLRYFYFFCLRRIRKNSHIDLGPWRPYRRFNAKAAQVSTKTDCSTLSGPDLGGKPLDDIYSGLGLYLVLLENIFSPQTINSNGVSVDVAYPVSDVTGDEE